MTRGLIIGMIVFDLFLHTWEWLTGNTFVMWANYNMFWTGFFLILLSLVIYEFYGGKDDKT